MISIILHKSKVFILTIFTFLFVGHLWAAPNLTVMGIGLYPYTFLDDKKKISGVIPDTIDAIADFLGETLVTKAIVIGKTGTDFSSSLKTLDNKMVGLLRGGVAYLEKILFL